ncbi:MAG: hypothetical protein N2050_07880 [Flavobacteriales bacterium]|nr:hypothetical protein [Flavobacteriales bacterium]
MALALPFDFQVAGPSFSGGSLIHVGAGGYLYFGPAGLLPAREANLARPRDMLWRLVGCAED